MLDTPRLRLRAWDESDANTLHAAFGDPETMRFWDTPARRRVAETAAMIRESLATDSRYHAAFAITLRETGQPVGMVNYHDRRPLRRRLAVGWILLRSWQHQGIMREAVPAFLAIVSSTSTRTGSRRASRTKTCRQAGSRSGWGFSAKG